MDSELLNELITVNLRYTPGARPLKNRAISQMAAKVLYTLPSNKTATVEEVSDDIAVVVGVDKVPVDDTKEALRFLKSIGFAVDEGEEWRLSAKGNKEIEIDFVQSRALINSILERHFPQAIPEIQITTWFRDACVEYFGRYGTYWASSITGEITKAAPATASLRNIITITVNKRAIDQKYVDALTNGFTKFINSNDQRDIDGMWYFGQAMFAARLMAARVGADPLTTSLIKNAIFLLDTNVLIISCLEAHRLATSFKSLSKALKKLNIKLMFLPITQVEYKHAMLKAREDTVRVISRYSAGVYVNVKDAFTRTAIGRGCKNIKDFEDFFDEIVITPSKIDDEQVELCQDEELIRAAEQGAVNEDLLHQVAEVWKSLKNRDKPENNVIHDASLMYAVEDANARNLRYWALSLDRSMNLLASRRSGKHELPYWVTLDALLQILAVELAGPSLQAENFGPLMATILENEMQPMPGTFETRDLAWLLDIEERCADLSEEQVVTCATIINQARLTGKKHDDPELQLDVQRAFQGDRLDLAKEVSTTKADLAITKGDLELAIGRLEEFQKALVTEENAKLRRADWKSFTLKTVPTALVGVGCIVLAIWFALNFSTDDSLLKNLGIPSVLFAAGAITVPVMLFKQVSRLRESLRTTLTRAEKQVETIYVK